MSITLANSDRLGTAAALASPKRRVTAGRIFAGGTPALALALAVACGPADVDRRTSAGIASGTAACDALECQLAVIEAGHRVSAEDPLVARMRAHLDRLSNDYPESRQQIADMTVNVQSSLRQQGMNESLDQLLTGFAKIPHPQPRYPSYRDVGASYLALRSQGFSHDSATAGLGAIMIRLGELRTKH